MMSWEELQHRQLHGYPPIGEPGVYAELAPFKLWIVPPGQRCARLLDIVQVIRHEQATNTTELDGMHHPPEIPIQDLPAWFERLDIPWLPQRSLDLWTVRETGEQLIIWQSGKRASELVRVPVSEVLLEAVVDALKRRKDLPYGVGYPDDDHMVPLIEISNRELRWLHSVMEQITQRCLAADTQQRQDQM